MEQIKLLFPRFSKYFCEAEHITIGVPFPKGALSSTDEIALFSGDDEIFCQKSVTGRWPDGSIRWVLLDFQTDVDCSIDQELRLCYGDGVSSDSNFDSPIVLRETRERIEVDNGILRFAIPKDGFNLFDSLSLSDIEVISTGQSHGFSVTDRKGRKFSTIFDPSPRIEVELSGPLRTVIRARGSHSEPGGRRFIDYNVRIHVRAGKPYLVISYQFINREEGEFVLIDEISYKLGLGLPTDGSAVIRSAENGYSTRLEDMIVRGRKGLEITSGRSAIRAEGIAECYVEDSWIGWWHGERGMATCIRHMSANFPKRISLDRRGMSVDLYPKSREPLKLYQGSAKTHEMMFLFHDGTITPEEISQRTFLFHLPPMPVIPAEWYQRCGVLGEIYPPTPGGCSRIEAVLKDMIDSKPRGYGMMHFGDEPNQAYTAQERGGGDVVWTNNEYDTPHICLVEYARSGERRFFSIAEAAAKHWIDVDHIHYSPDPMKSGGLCIHSADHCRGQNVSPSHEWVDGLFEYYHWTWDVEAKEVGMAVGENIMRYIEKLGPGGYSVREIGWTLYNVLGLYEETCDDKYLAVARKLVENIGRWAENEDGLRSPYTLHFVGHSVFMSAITLIALKRYHLITGDKIAERIIIGESDRLIEEALSPEGIFYYKEFPSVRYYSEAGLMMLEPLEYCYRLTGNRRYMAIGMRNLEHFLSLSNMRLCFLTGAEEIREVKDAIVKLPIVIPPNAQTLGLTIKPLFPFLKTADELGMLGRIDYAY